MSMSMRCMTARARVAGPGRRLLAGSRAQATAAAQRGARCGQPAGCESYGPDGKAAWGSVLLLAAPAPSVQCPSGPSSRRSVCTLQVWAISGPGRRVYRSRACIAILSAARRHSRWLICWATGAPRDLTRHIRGSLKPSWSSTILSSQQQGGCSRCGDLGTYPRVPYNPRVDAQC